MCSVYETALLSDRRECRAVESEKTFAIPSVNGFSNKRNGPPVRLIIGPPSASRTERSGQMDFDAYYEASYDRVRRAMTLAFRDPDFAEEITQEAFFQRFDDGRGSHDSITRRLDDDRGLNKGRDDHRRRVRQTTKYELLAGPRQLT